MAAQSKTVLKAALPLLAAMVATIVLVTIVLVLLAFQQFKQQKEQAATQYQQRALALISNYMDEQQAFVTDLAKTPSDIIVGHISGTLLARVIPAGSETPTDLSFTNQDFVRRNFIAKGKLAPEASLVNGQPVVAILKPLADGKGQLLVNVSLKPLIANLSALVGKNNQLLLTQKLEKDTDPMTLIDLQGSQLTTTGFTTVNPNWTLRLQPAPVAGLTLWVALGLGVVLLVVPMAGFVLVRRFDSGLRQDMVGLLAVIKGQSLPEPLNFAASELVWKEVANNGVTLGASKPVAATATKADLTDAILAEPVMDSMAARLSPASSAPVLNPDLILDLDEPAPDAAATKSEEEVKELSALEFTLSKDGKAGVAGSNIPSHIFRAYDIRGKAHSEISPELAKQIGQAIGSEAQARGEQSIVVGRDTRLSSAELSTALIEGLVSTGCQVINVGQVPTPVLYYAAKNLVNGSGVMVTASHNPAPDNGFKIMIANHTLVADEIMALRQRIIAKDFVAGNTGVVSQRTVTEDYLQQIVDDVILARPFNVVVDAANGVAGPLIVQLLEQLGCTVSPLYCEPDGNFPNHEPDPCKQENLEDLLSDVAISGADLGIALDGDGDRLVVVTNSTKVIASDRLLMLFAKDMLATQPGADILFDVKCSRDLVNVITSHGGRPVMTRTGHAWLKAGVAETNAPLAGEMSGHFIFNDRWQGFDDGLYAAARFLEILSTSMGTADDLFTEFPERYATPELQVLVSEDHKHEVIDKLVAASEDILDGTVNTTDGLRVEFTDGWGLVRASNTGAYLVVRFEGHTEDALDRIKAYFRDLLRQADPMLLLPF